MSSYTGIKRLTTSKTFMSRLSLVVRLIIAAILIFFSVFPVLWIISSSINPSNSLASVKLIPDNWSFNNFYILLPTDDAAIREVSTNLLGQDIFPHAPEGKFVFPFWNWWWNSIKIASISTVLGLSITTMAAFAFSRFRFAGRQTLLKLILLIQVFPNLLALVAIFLMIAEIGDIVPRFGLDTHAGLILVYLGGSMGMIFPVCECGRGPPGGDAGVGPPPPAGCGGRKEGAGRALAGSLQRAPALPARSGDCRPAAMARCAGHRPSRVQGRGGRSSRRRRLDSPHHQTGRSGTTRFPMGDRHRGTVGAAAAAGPPEAGDRLSGRCAVFLPDDEPDHPW